MSFNDGEIPLASKFNDLASKDDLSNAVQGKIDEITEGQTSAAVSAESASTSATVAQNALVQTQAAADSVAALVDVIPDKQQFTELQTSVDAITADPTNAVSSIVIPAKDFDLAIGSATYGMIASRLAGWQFSNGADASITKMIDLPSHWTTMRITIIWSNLVANTGNVSFSGLIHSWASGESFNVTPAGGGTVAAANATPYIDIETQIALDITIDPTRHTTIRIGRNGSSASDTLPTAMVILAVNLTKVA
ncbi:hypothetical protein [Martelella alba]|uniref:Uncharacterized protein n=1 Tax=Martelella alba TaxID=2590451 RepID=A0ABY2SEL2_9HYPH|nr:hypothetical protein [Martelella alba]TKI02388.1 hypothetical protein FCN80_25170 [Martelella alba]